MFTQVIFNGTSHTYAYDISDIKLISSGVNSFQYRLPIPLDGLAPDTYTVQIMYMNGCTIPPLPLPFQKNPDEINMPAASGTAGYDKKPVSISYFDMETGFLVIFYCCFISFSR